MGIFSIGNAAAGLLLVLYTYNTGLLEVALQLFDCIDFPLLVQTLDHQFQVGISDQIACLLDRCESTWDEGDTGPLRIPLHSGIGQPPCSHVEERDQELPPTFSSRSRGKFVSGGVATNGNDGVEPVFVLKVDRGGAPAAVLATYSIVTRPTVPRSGLTIGLLRQVACSAVFLWSFTQTSITIKDPDCFCEQTRV